MTLRLFDTYTRSLRDFEPLQPAVVSMYACGPTVCDYAHIGNLRTYISPYDFCLVEIEKSDPYPVGNLIKRKRQMRNPARPRSRQ